MLQRLGLDRLTHSVYRQLITGRHRGVDELADHLGVFADEVHLALERLRKLDLLRPSGDPLGELVDPRLALKALLLRQMSGIEDRLREFEADRTAVMTLIDRYTESRPGGWAPGFECVVGRAAVTDRLCELSRVAETEWLAFLPDGAPSVSWLEPLQELQCKVLDRGVANRAVTTDSIRGDTRLALRAVWEGEPGSGVRTVPSLPVHLLLVDRSLALLPTDPHDPWHRVVQITAPGAVEALNSLFERVWEAAVPLGSSGPGLDEHGLSSREKELLRLLARGLNDEAIRRRLGVSLRTVRRIVADLCARLGAASRFEAGYQAAKRGWI
ncbi:helix-turn-helix transcriptional regulator [Streptomyces griseomycini]|uniref:DNA-binding CsgD family transcriptional regulator n=1 Tax=Streptomyces griseomycini TaxID=66895 RepID=A0A7W7LZI2_9ACTN|nr:helix-turn-helix transcriptional regulator [Streptomyces griseomycini]MBB4898558.1 DNA-binding CsgD family transcriptional regulator [Streptomyces griseomycini]